MNLFNIRNSYNDKISRNWDKVYWMIDMHNTIIPGLYSEFQELEFYPYAQEVLRKLYLAEDTVLILYTCSHEAEIYRFQEWFSCHGIVFDYVNENPEVPDTALGRYSDKPYFNIMLDDKAGFEPVDWIAIRTLLHELYGGK